MHIKATVITADGQRVTLSMICNGRPQAEQTIDTLYPGARYSSVIVVRRAREAAC